MEFLDPAYPLSELTREVIGAFYRTYDTFGYGFLESPYKRALVLELQHAGLTVEREVPSSCSTSVNRLASIAPT